VDSHSGAGQVIRVPVEHRIFGMDRRSFPIGLIVIAVFLVATVVIPRIDRAIEWDDPVKAGQRLSLTESLSFAPTTGWNVERGFRVGTSKAVLGHGPATVVGDGVTFEVFPDSFDGTPAELLRQIDKVTSATGNDPSFQAHDDPTTVETSAGDTGVLQTYSSIRGDGIIAAFVIDGTGIRVTAFGPPEQMTAAADDIEAMIVSIGPSGTDGGAS
jgi:hypothetical protein